MLKKTVKKAYEDEVDPEDIKLPKTQFEKENTPYFRQLNFHNIMNYYNQLEWNE